MTMENSCSDEEGERFTFNLGLWVSNVLDGCMEDERVKIYRSFGRLFTRLVDRIQGVLDADKQTGASLLELPNLLPRALVKLSGVDLTNLIRKKFSLSSRCWMGPKRLRILRQNFMV